MPFLSAQAGISRFTACIARSELVRRDPEVDRDFILVNISLHIAPQVGRARVHEVFENIDNRIKQHYPNVRRVFIESENPPLRNAAIA
jgi:hypothetical protein